MRTLRGSPDGSHARTDRHENHPARRRLVSTHLEDRSDEGGGSTPGGGNPRFLDNSLESTGSFAKGRLGTEPLKLPSSSSSRGGKRRNAVTKSRGGAAPHRHTVRWRTGTASGSDSPTAAGADWADRP